MSTVGGYLEYRGGVFSTVGGYREYRGGISRVPWGAILSTVGVFSTVGIS